MESPSSSRQFYGCLQKLRLADAILQDIIAILLHREPDRLRTLGATSLTCNQLSDRVPLQHLCEGYYL